MPRIERSSQERCRHGDGTMHADPLREKEAVVSPWGQEEEVAYGNVFGVSSTPRYRTSIFAVDITFYTSASRLPLDQDCSGAALHGLDLQPCLLYTSDAADE